MTGDPEASGPIHPHVALVRRWAVDWLTGRNARAAEEILAPEYTLQIGGFSLGPREAYMRATTDQFGRFPGLAVTVHRLVNGGDGVAVWLSEHGASAQGGRQAAWNGVSLFRWNGSALTACFAEEDYQARRRQLDSGVSDPVHPPAVAPWNEQPEPRSPAAEAAVVTWLGLPDQRVAPVVVDDEDEGQPPVRILEVTGTAVNALFSAGEQVAFHATQRGAYLGGLPGVDRAAQGTEVDLHVAGIVTVRDGLVTGGRVVRDRLGTARRLKA